MKSQNIKATIFIPTYNGEKYLNEILKMIFKQDVDFLYNILIIDSGSTDKTIDIINKYKNKYPDMVSFKQIDKNDFGHGKTRNQAAQIADGEYIVYLSHDAVPATKRWLYEMVKPFELNDKIKGVTGKQTPRPKCVPLLKYEINAVFKNLGTDAGTTLFYKDTFMKNPVYSDTVTFYSDVNSAAPRKFLLEVMPYRDVPYSEDQMYGQDLIEAGYMKAYSSRGEVVHSNDLTLKEYKHRIFDEIVGLRTIGTKIKQPSILAVLRMIFTGVLKDAYRTLRDSEYSFKRKVFWLLVNPLYHFEKWRGFRLAMRVHLADLDKLNQHSLEARRG
ncbi:MAG: Rhamnosyl transferase [Candidatus Saccharibacteria bacterium]|nr:Rhamnosyl transferase [Candidatus Saccharibacteria bacterium]